MRSVASSNRPATVAALPRRAPMPHLAQSEAVRDAWPGVQAFLLAFLLVGALAASQGGYLPPAWDWSALVLLLACAVLLVARTQLRLGVLDVVAPALVFALALWGLVSALWSPSLTHPMLESQRTLMYAVALFASALIVRTRSRRALLAGVWLAIALVGMYALLTRLLPERLGYIDPVAGYRLAQPIGYWNGLGLFAAIGLILAFGFAARGRNVALRACAAASMVPLACTLYFTFSRGAWIALGAGVVAAIVLDRRRLQLITTLVLFAPGSAIAVWRGSRSAPLTHIGTNLAVQSHAGHHFALTVLLLALVGALVAIVLGPTERVVRIPLGVQRGYGAALVVVVVAALAVITARFGSPPTIVSHLYHDFVGPSQNVQHGNLNTRLFNLSGGQRIPQWKVAWREYKMHPWLGSGYGSYENYWYEYRPAALKVVNAHNLYLETLAELGPVGLILLLTALALPLVAAFRSRDWAFTSLAFGAYVAFLVHAIVDWDWQLPAVTLAALLCGSALLISRRQDRPLPAALRSAWRFAALGLTIVLAALFFVLLRGNRAIAAAEGASSHQDWNVAAANAQTATDWAPWSSQAWQLLGEVQQAQGKLGAARVSLRAAVRRDPSDWTIWFDLATVTTGRERAHAIAYAARLNPLDPDVQALEPSGGGG
jgi:hypothetical protein